jgi:hypothetical protein
MWIWPILVVSVAIMLSAACSASNDGDYIIALHKINLKMNERNLYQIEDDIPNVYSYIMKNSEISDVVVLEDEIKPRKQPKIKANFCHFCGARRVKNAIYCYQCGTKLE